MALSKHRRSNAGNRLQALLEDQAPLDAADAEFFAEKEDDEDFDIEAEEERIRRERREAANADSSSGEEEGGEEKESNKQKESKRHMSPANDDGEEDNDDESSVSAADSNFSDSSDDSDIENDAEPADAGERQLQQEQRQRNRAKKTAERSKMFTIKRRPPPVPEGAEPPKSKKKRLFTSADLIMEKGRKSERRSALRNKEHLIEQMKAAEERRAQYVHPAKPRAPKLTQEQRLEEAKKTEIRNLSTLNKFVELEEERKLQQRLAMISRRPKLTHFVRFHSSSFMEPPKIIELVSEIYPRNSLEATPEPLIKTEHMPLVTETHQRSHSEPLQNVSNNDPKMVNMNDNHESHVIDEESKDTEGNMNQSKPQDLVNKLENTNDKTTDADKFDTTHQLIDDNTPENKNSPENADDNKENISNIGDKPSPDPSVVKTEPSLETSAQDPAPEPKTETLDDNEELPLAQGPEYLRSYNFLTLHEFPDVSLNKFSIRNIVLGSSANSSQPPLKRMCPFDGNPAKYRDPNTNVAYTSLETCRLIRMVQENKLGWSKELGGVFTMSGSPQRPAKGVPEGF